MTKEELIGKNVILKDNGFTHKYKVLDIDETYVFLENETLDASGKFTHEQFEKFTGVKIEL